MTDSESTPEPTAFRWTTEWPDEHGPWLVTLDLRVQRGRLEAIGVSMSPRARLLHDSPIPLTSTDLRLPLGRLVQQARSEQGAVLRAVAQMTTWPPESPWEPPVDPDTLGEPGGRRRRRPEHDHDYYIGVARIYREALTTTGRPTLAVQEQLQISYSLAAKFVTEARRRGLLPPTTRGRMSQPEDAPATPRKIRPDEAR